MRHALPLLALILALPAAAQTFVDPTKLDEIDAALEKAAALRERLKPAKVDKEPVQALFEKLSKQGEQIEMEQGIGNVLTRLGTPDAGGRMRNVQATLVEVPAEAVEPQDAMVNHAVMRRYFSHLEATSESWDVDAGGDGRLDVWNWTVGLDGTLISVTHQIAPVKGGAPDEAKMRAYRMSPSDPSVQRRWKALTKDLLRLGKLIEV